MAKKKVSSRSGPKVTHVHSHDMMMHKRGCDSWTWISYKLAIASFVIVVLKLWTGANNWVMNTNVWWFVAALVIFGLRAKHGYSKSC